MNPKPPSTHRETPASLGYRMPAEWDRHDATWIAWPHNKGDWPGKFGPVPWVFAEIVRRLVRSELVQILIPGKALKAKAADRLKRSGVDPDRVAFHKVATNRVWTRDTGPTFVVNPTLPAPLSLGLVDWRFNGWAKYDDHEDDDRVPRKLAERLGLPRWSPEVELAAAAGQADRSKVRVVLEGGSIDVNGRGTLLTTEECLLSDVQARNPGLSKDDLERVFAEYLGVSHVVWLGRGIAGDDTHGHVDDLARFVNPRTVVTVVESDESDENFAPLRENLERLRSATDQDGRALEVVQLPMPRPVVFEGQRLPASYANFYVANDIVLVPTFNDPADRVALSILADHFPGREVVGIHAVDLVWGLGTIHCMTQQQPSPPDFDQPAARAEDAASVA